MKSARVNVYVGGRAAGALSRSAREQDLYLFAYQHDCPDDAAVSLTMPVMPDPYDAMGIIHPIFEMNLPEGLLRQKLEQMFAKIIPNFDSLALLEVIGRSQVGRLRYAPAGEYPEDVPEENLTQLLTYHGADDLFNDLLEKYAQHSGISGMQPKIMLRSAEAGGRITSRGATHIIKSFDAKEHPELAANEFFCMQASRYAGLPTAVTQLSENRQLLAVTRFDVVDEGRYLGFEDFCVLSGMRASGRYQSSYEDLARKIALYVSPDNKVQAMHDYFSMVVLACTIRNGDAHLKNFGVLYDRPGSNVRLAPVYDMLSTTPYQPRDVLALEMNGSKTFPDRAQLLQFARSACGLSRINAEQGMARVAKGIEMARAEMRAYAQHVSGFQEAAKHLDRVFSGGLALLAGSANETSHQP